MARKASTADGIAGNPRGVVWGTDDDEVVVHHRPPLGAEPLLHKGQFRRGAVGQHDVDFAAFAQLQRRPGADRDRLEGVAGRLGEQRTERIEQAGIGGAGRRGQDDVLRAGPRLDDRRALRAHRSGGNDPDAHPETERDEKNTLPTHASSLRVSARQPARTSPPVMHDHA